MLRALERWRWLTSSARCFGTTSLTIDARWSDAARGVSRSGISPRAAKGRWSRRAWRRHRRSHGSRTGIAHQAPRTPGCGAALDQACGRFSRGQYRPGSRVQPRGHLAARSCSVRRSLAALARASPWTGPGAAWGHGDRGRGGYPSGLPAPASGCHLMGANRRHRSSGRPHGLRLVAGDGSSRQPS